MAMVRVIMLTIILLGVHGDSGDGDFEGDLSSLASSAFFTSISLVGISSPPYRCLLII